MTKQIFEFHNTALHAATPDIFGVWATRPQKPISGAVSFGVGAIAAEPDMPTWKVRLPSEPAYAEAIMDNAQGQLDGTRRNLPDAHDTIQKLVKQTKKRYGQDMQAGVSFSTAAPSTPLSQEEEDFLTVLRQIEQSDPSSANVSFGMRETVYKGWENLQEVQELISQIYQSIAHYVRIETEIQNRTIGTTTVSWIGDFQTAWRKDIQAEHIALHKKSLRLALTSRDTLLQAIQETMTLAFMVSTPGGAIVAIPAAWKLMNRLLQKREDSHGN